ncbi:hypothetical protein T12_7305 [Trichinella patagoniensis]|uniref:Uncharacterized protein n=1 Tax=Trichinella patagoniensis TaxID=990121 RepID=A0A0V0Z8V0_9BILA|nr:hypothetical protein T12_7305 [Trichinella patagoniensis]
MKIHMRIQERLDKQQSRILSNWRKQALNDHSRRNGLLRWDFKVHIRSRSSSTPIRHLSLYRPQGVDIDHFGYPCFRCSMSQEKQLIVSAVVKLKHVFEMLSSSIELSISVMLKSKAIHDIIHSNK